MRFLPRADMLGLSRGVLHPAGDEGIEPFTESVKRGESDRGHGRLP